MVAVCWVFRQIAVVVCQMLCAKCCRESVVTVSVRMRHRVPTKGRRYTEPLSARHFGLDTISRLKHNFVNERAPENARVQVRAYSRIFFICINVIPDSTPGLHTNQAHL